MYTHSYLYLTKIFYSLFIYYWLIAFEAQSTRMFYLSHTQIKLDKKKGDDVIGGATKYPGDEDEKDSAASSDASMFDFLFLKI